MSKFIKLKYKAKSKEGHLIKKEMVINKNTINRIVVDKKTAIISTPIFPRGYKNQVVKLDKEDFKFLMEQLND